jgi:hypothetical protein
VKPSAPTAASPDADGGRTGVVVVPKSAVGRRVFIDGEVVDATNSWLEVPCGAHKIQIGSKGSARPIQVPCGGEIEVK